VFLDIETKSKHENYSDLPAKFKLLFSQQWEWLIEQTAHRHYLDDVLSKKEEGDHELCFQKATEEIYKEKAHLSPEFSEIICISAGMIMEDYTFKCASFCGESEKDILNQFLANKKSFIHQDAYANNEKYIVVYNGKGFDLPFLAKRIMYNSLDLPATLNIGHLKPWELGHIIDVKEHLKFGGMDSPSLEALCTVMGVETAQDKFKTEASELAGKHKAKEYDFIKQYCEHDIFALAQVYLRLIRSKEHPQGITNILTKV
jgi:predicted PolB exonuclease-like 3'-5' exonuclease